MTPEIRYAFARCFDPPAKSASFIATVTAIYLMMGLGAFLLWRFTGDTEWVVDYFHVPAALLAIWLAVQGFRLSRDVVNHYSSSDWLRPGWMSIVWSNLFALGLCLFFQLLGDAITIHPLLPLTEHATLLSAVRNLGLGLGRLLRFGLLAVGLIFALRACQRLRLLRKLKLIDGALLLALGVFLIRRTWEVLFAFSAGARPDTWQVLTWLIDPMLGCSSRKRSCCFAAPRESRRGELASAGRLLLSAFF